MVSTIFKKKYKVGRISLCNFKTLYSYSNPHCMYWWRYRYIGTSLVSQKVKCLSTMWKTWVQSLVWEDLLEKGKATHSSILAWRIPGTVWSMGSQRVRHD